MPQWAIMKNKNRNKIKAGFTLFELIITIVVVGILAIPLSLLISQQVQSVAQSKHLAMALDLARFEMERINNLVYDDVKDMSFSDYEGYKYDIVREVRFVAGDDTTPESLKKITITVRESGSTVDLITLISYIVKNVSYGFPPQA